MAFDASGYLWVGTQDGLAIFDGRDWKVRNLPNRTESNFVRALVISADGSVWCGRENGGVSRLQGEHWDSWSIATGGPRGRINVLCESTAASGSAAIWAATTDGLARFQNNEWRIFTSADGLPSDNVGDVAEVHVATGTTELWAATTRGLARFDGSRFVPIEIPGTDPADGVQCIGQVSTDTGGTSIWLGVGAGKIAIDTGGTWSAMSIDVTGPATCIAETREPDGKRVVWVGTDESGLLRYQNGRWHAFDASSGMPNNSIWSLLPVDAPDGTTALWIGTDGGVGRLPLGRWTTFDSSVGLPTDSAYAFAETVDADGVRSIWIGARGGGLARLRNNVWTVFNTTSGIPSNSVFSLLNATNEDGSTTLWAGTQGGGLARFSGERWVPVPVAGALRPTIRKLIQSVAPDGRHELWAASGNVGLLHFKEGVWSVVDTEPALQTKSLFCVLEVPQPDGRRELWVGTQGHGLGRLVDGVWSAYNSKNSRLPNDSVLSLHERTSHDGHRELWAGTEGGGAAYLDLDNPDAGWTVMSDATVPALPNNTVYQIQEDARGRLYIFTNKGCARLTPRAPTEDDPTPFGVYVFRTEDGLPSNEFNGGASMIDGLGRIWAGTPKGVAVFDPSREVDDTRSLPLYVRGTQLRDGALLGDNQTLRYNQNSLTFEYNLLSLFRGRDTRYRTQLIGLEENPSDWTPDFKRSFTALPTGSYVFRVWARDYRGTVSGPIDTTFEIRPAPWKTWWAYVLYVLVLAGAAYLLVRARLSALRRRNEELERGIAERTAQIAEKVVELEVSEKTAQAAKNEALRAKEDALEANRAKSIFLSNMSHELRTPLNAVLGFAQLMEREPGRLPEDRENLGIIMRSGEHLLGLINDVLSISKIEAGKLTLNEATFDLRRMLQGLEEMLGPRAHAKGLRMMFDLAPDIPQYVRGDDGKLRQVLINLLNNALKFTDTGGIALRARWADGRAAFEVEDTGKGIAADEIVGIFEAFVQSETGRTSKEGTGLGLAISRNFVQLMGGDITVRSEVGKGTVFAFEADLPLADSADQPRAHRRVKGLAPGERGARILVVDDRWENRALLVKLLRTVGFEVREAANGREAVDEWDAWRPALIWMDMRMPVMDGRAATREIRRREGSGNRCKILALTASAFEHERGAVLAAGCDDFVTKPYREATIFEKLESFLGTRFVYDEPDASGPATSEALLTPERLVRVPAELIEELQAALVLGNVKDAQFVVDNIAQVDQGLADDLRRLVRSYQFDEILDTIEACGIR